MDRKISLIQPLPNTPRGDTTPSSTIGIGSFLSNVVEPSAIVAIVCGIGKAEREVGFAAFDPEGELFHASSAFVADS